MKRFITFFSFALLIFKTVLPLIECSAKNIIEKEILIQQSGSQSVYISTKLEMYRKLLTEFCTISRLNSEIREYLGIIVKDMLMKKLSNY